MEMHVVHLLMRRAPVVLQDVVVRSPGGFGDALRDAQYLVQRLIRDISQFGTVVLWDDELEDRKRVSGVCVVDWGVYPDGRKRRTAWP